MYMIPKGCIAVGLFAGLVVSLPGCNTAPLYRKEADQAAYRITRNSSQEALGRAESYSIERPSDTLRRRLLLDQQLVYADPASLGTTDLPPAKHWPDPEYLTETAPAPVDDMPSSDTPLQLTLLDTLQIAARNNRAYQTRKEQVYQAALDLDLERDFFRFTWAGLAESLLQTDLEEEVVINDKGDTDRQTVTEMQNTGVLRLTKRLENGMTLTGLIGLDLVNLLTQDRTSSRGLYADASVSIPLLRGSGRFVVTEPLTQAERNVVYAIYQFERYKRVFAVDIASEYLSVLQQLDQWKNAEDNYERLLISTRGIRRKAEAGLLPGIQVDQARQNELRARNRWIIAQEGYKRRLDEFKVLLGLPTDAAIELDNTAVEKLSEALAHMMAPPSRPAGEEEALPADAPATIIPPDPEHAGPLEMDEIRALILALENRLDLRVARGRVDDTQRKVAVAADALRADLTLLGSGSIGERRLLGSSASPDARMRFNEGRYSALVGLDLPLERTAERNLYRNSLIVMEQSIRDYQELEDQIKLEIRDHLRRLLESRESVRIQAEAVRLAQRRVESTDLFLQAGRAQVRDLLEAQEALISAQNALTAALVQYRVAEWALQRDLGVLEVDETGLWKEYVPEGTPNDHP
ncbi:MAG: TolC family protein [Phycisphaerales bacterium]|nr:TolC family protein [Phycisphaerales bacterium]